VVVEDKFPAQVLEQDRLLQLSVDADVLYCVVEEHMMLSHSSFFSGGRRLWMAEHNAQRAWDDLISVGSLPEEFDTLRRDLFAKQMELGGSEADVDYIFDVPLRLAQELCGYRHDEGSYTYVVLDVDV